MRVPKFLILGVCLILCFQFIFFIGFGRRRIECDTENDGMMFNVFQEKRSQFYEYLENEKVINDFLSTYDVNELPFLTMERESILNFLSNNDDKTLVPAVVEKPRAGPVTSESRKNEQGFYKYCFAFYATNNNYACGVKVNIYHILKNSAHFEFDIMVYVSDDGLIRYFKDFDPRQLNPEWKGRFIVKKVNDVPTPANGLYKWTFIKTVPFREVQYERLITMDADILGPLKDLTHLFNLPPTSFAAPIGYWENELCFTATLMAFKPSMEMFEKITNLASPKAFRNTEQHVLNYYFRPKTRGGFYIIRDMVLLPLEYTTLTHSVRKTQDNNPEYVGSPKEAYDRSYLVHFSEGGKPWMSSDRDGYEGDVFNEWRRIAKDVCH